MSLTLHAVTVLVDDYDRAISYFRDMLGFELVEDTQISQTKRWVRVCTPNSLTCLLLAKATGESQKHAMGSQTGNRISFFLQTDDFEKTYADYRAKGVTFLETPRLEPYGHVVKFQDIYGNGWDLIQPK